MKNFISNNFGWLVAVVLFVIILFQTCKRRKSGNIDQPIIDTVTVSDTTYLTQPTKYIMEYVPKIVRVPGRVDTVYEEVEDPSSASTYEALRKDYTVLFDRFHTTNIYNDSITLRDSSGKDVGLVTLKDRVVKNQIAGRAPSYTLKFPTITNTTTITKQLPPQRRTQLYAGIGLGGNQDDYLNEATAGLMLKNKRDHLYGVGVSKGLQSNTPLQYNISTFWKISLGKNKFNTRKDRQ